MLLSVGGNAAVEYWQRLLEDAEGEVDHIKTYAEEDDDEVGGVSVVLPACWSYGMVWHGMMVRTPPRPPPCLHVPTPSFFSSW